MARTLLKITLIKIARSPTVFPMAMRLTVCVATNIHITVAETLLSSSMLKECFKRAYVARSPSMAESSSSLLPIILPFSFIMISLRRLPFSPTIFAAHQPLSLKDLAILPLKLSIPMATSILKASFINSLPISLITIYFRIILKAAFINLFIGDTYSQSLSFLLLDLSKIHSAIKRYNMEVWSF